MSHSLNATREATGEPTREAPLLSDEARDFVEGNLAAKDYIEHARQEAEVQARLDLRPRISPIILAVGAILGALFVVSYIIVAIISFTSGPSSVGYAAIGTGAAALIATIAVQRRRIRERSE